MDLFCLLLSPGLLYSQRNAEGRRVPALRVRDDPGDRGAGAGARPALGSPFFRSHRGRAPSPAAWHNPSRSITNLVARNCFVGLRRERRRPPGKTHRPLPGTCRRRGLEHQNCFYVPITYTDVCTYQPAHTSSVQLPGACASVPLTFGGIGEGSPAALSF